MTPGEAPDTILGQVTITLRDVQVLTDARVVSMTATTINIDLAERRPLTEEEHPRLAAIWDNDSDDVFDRM